MEKGYIYIIKNRVNNKCYIGQTKKTIEERWREHIFNHTRRKQAIYMAMRKYGIENFYIEEVESVDIEKLNDREIYWINKLNTVSPNGYNISTGGDFNDCNPMYIPEVVKKVSAKLKGNKNPAKRIEVKEKIRQTATGKTANKETRKKMSENNGRYWLGKPLPEEMKQKISQNHGMRGKFGSLNPNSRKVARRDINTNEIIEIYGSFKEAEKWVRENENINPTASYAGMSRCCNNNGQKTAYGYRWSYVEEV